MPFAPIFMSIFVIDESKYVDIKSFKAIGDVSLSEVHAPSITRIILKNAHSRMVKNPKRSNSVSIQPKFVLET